MTTATATAVDLERLLAGGQLPALPQSAIKILELSKDPDNGPAEFAKPIECDPGLTGQVLRFVNSSYFGFSREISSVKLAITLVGIRTIKNFTLWSAVFSLMPNPKCGPFDLKSLWQDSLRRALFARAMARLMGQKEAEEPFAAALLQDMAIPLLAKELPQDYLRFLSERNQGQVRLSQIEAAHFGWSHAQAAAQMAHQWNLPQELVTPIQRHTELEALLADAKATPCTLSVALSALLPATVDGVWNERAAFEAAYDKLRGAAGPSALEMLSQIDREFTEFAPVLKVSAPSKSLADVYQGS